MMNIINNRYIFSKIFLKVSFFKVIYIIRTSLELKREIENMKLCLNIVIKLKMMEVSEVFFFKKKKKLKLKSK